VKDKDQFGEQPHPVKVLDVDTISQVRTHSSVSVCKRVYKPEARINNLACWLVKNVCEIARKSIENFEIHVQYNHFGLLKFNSGYKTFYLNSPMGYGKKIFSTRLLYVNGLIIIYMDTQFN